jgi:hypothetical protein
MNLSISPEGIGYDSNNLWPILLLLKYFFKIIIRNKLRGAMPNQQLCEAILSVNELVCTPSGNSRADEENRGAGLISMISTSFFCGHSDHVLPVGP